VRRAAGSVMASAVGWGWGSSRLDGVVLPWHSPPPAAVGGREGNGGVDHRHGGGGGRRPPSSGTGQHFAALLRAAVARSLTLSTALAGLDGGDAAACWRNPAMGGHATAADARAVSRLLQEQPRAPACRPRPSAAAAWKPAALHRG